MARIGLPAVCGFGILFVGKYKNVLLAIGCMARVLIVGDGPAGVSSGILLAKKGLDPIIFGKDTTKIHHAQLYNYPGIKQISGTDFIKTARDQYEYFGGEYVDSKITTFRKSDNQYFVQDAEGTRYKGKYIILATGHFMRGHPPELGVKSDAAGRINVDTNNETNVEGVYAVGVATRTEKIQVAISVGDGATAALDIVEKEQDGLAHDFDTHYDNKQV